MDRSGRDKITSHPLSNLLIAHPYSCPAPEQGVILHWMGRAGGDINVKFSSLHQKDELCKFTLIPATTFVKVTL